LDADGRLAHDRVQLASEVCAETALLQPRLQDGRRIGPTPTLEESRAHCAAQLCALPQHLRSLQPATRAYRVDISDALRALALQVDASTR
jgi:hypothetical protein